MTSDTAVFEAMHPDPEGGEDEWIGRLGTRDAINRDGMEVDVSSLAYCPHEWINDASYIDLELVRRFPLFLAH